MTDFENRTSPAPRLATAEPFISAHGRAQVVVALFVAFIAVALFSIVTNVLGLASEPIVLASEDGQEVTLGDLLQLLSALAALVVYLSLVVAFLLWLYRASKNLRALDNRPAEHSPAWAVGSFFVPFVNLIVPYKAVREVWEKSDPPSRTGDSFIFAEPTPAPPLLGWWISWLVSNALGNLSWRLHSDAATPDALRFVAGFDILADVTHIISAVLAIYVVRGIDRRQQESSRHVTYVQHLPPPPPDFSQQPQHGA